MATFADAVNAIEARLRDNWSTTPIAFENDNEPETAGPDGKRKPWVLCEVVTTRSAIKSVGRPGNHITVTNGIVALTLFVPRGGGKAGREQARILADDLADIFRTVRFHQVEPGVYVQTWTPEIGPGNHAKSENPSGAWWAMGIMTPFEFYHRA